MTALLQKYLVPTLPQLAGNDPVFWQRQLQLISNSINQLVANVTALNNSSSDITGKNFIWIDRGGTNQTALTNNSFVKVQFNNKNVDADSVFDATTNFRYTPNKAGKFLITGLVGVGNATDNLIDVAAAVYKNGSILVQGSEEQSLNAAPSISYFGSSFSTIVSMNGTTDFIEIFVFSRNNLGGNTSRIIGAVTNTYLMAAALA